MAAAKLADNGFDCEAWEIDGALWLVRRPRSWPVMAMAMWWTLAGTAALVVAAMGVMIAVHGPLQEAVVAGVIALAIAAWTARRGLRPYRADRAIRALPLHELPRVELDDARLVVDGTPEPRDGARWELEHDTSGDQERHSIVLVRGETRREVYYATRTKRLEPVVALLARRGAAVVAPR